ncbi:VOC family protein [Cytobacillus purgationiresistens]|uniref:Catechol 2,3-dioxygenase-like lactoylglutathione lyase family enzyme n=1 Tax=Cytobacillus purgationiresistens TaxID=863449 RepID=A0ABU0ANE5_9BACI|nr:VOC family protein [Cytobacillus purgationiresistens]MDQ0272806.1 catechol 2,3-dioxygenase-like lactoylglutathione lyase family enzyme [Cytobacillus purgationiresistens]
MKRSPVKNKIGGVFIPVKNIEKAREWYSKMLGLEGGEVYFGHLFAAEMKGSAGLILDTMPKWRDHQGAVPAYQTPAIQFVTDDLEASYQFMKDNEVQLVTEIEDDFYFVFKDPDGNMLMVCREM